ncbi:hypothetical protein SNE40_016088 [Patella caerulea]|uniref:WAP domain-containing protein n=1 Tax=Patella caerulea TaxID=87958 RepID=A0AAN8PMF6_PATCE
MKRLTIYHSITTIVINMNTVQLCLVLVCLVAVGPTLISARSRNSLCPAQLDPTVVFCAEQGDRCQTDTNCSNDEICCDGACGKYCRPPLSFDQWFREHYPQYFHSDV